MKKLFPFVVIGFLASCNAGDSAKVESMTTTDSTAQKDNTVYPYSPSYSSQFEVGDQAHSQTMLNLTKDWDANNLDHARQYFADSLTIFGADGFVLSGTADSVLAATKPYRENLGTVNTKVHAWVPLKAVDKNENWVLLWFTEYSTKPDGKKDSTEFQETWRLNKQGKADMVMQYLRKNPPPSK